MDLDECSFCDGQGEIQFNSGWPDPQCEDSETCPRCNGSGAETIQEVIPGRARLRQLLNVLVYCQRSSKRTDDALDEIEIILDRTQPKHLLDNVGLRDELGLIRYTLLCSLVNDRLKGRGDPNAQQIELGRDRVRSTAARPGAAHGSSSRDGEAEAEVGDQRYLVVGPHDGWAVVDTVDARAGNHARAIRCTGPESLMRMTAAEMNRQIPPITTWLQGYYQ